MSPKFQASSIHIELAAPRGSRPTEFRAIAVRFSVTALNPQGVQLLIGGESHDLQVQNGAWNMTWAAPTEGPFVLQVTCAGTHPPLTDVYWSRQVSTRRTPVIEEVRGAPPRESISLRESLAEVELRSEANTADHPGDQAGSPPALHTNWVVDELTDIGSAIESNIFQVRRKAFDQSLRAREFFLELDALRTGESSKHFSDEEQAAFVEGMTHVEYRLNYRLSLRSGMQPLGIQPDFPKEPLRQLQAVSLGFEKLHEAYLCPEQATGAPEDPHDLWAFAFEQFATDRGGAFHSDPRSQAVLLRQGQPDGEYFMCFAELALLCLDEACSTDFWRPKLLPLVMATHMFAEHRAPKDWFSPRRPEHPSNAIPFGYVEGLTLARSRRAEIHTEYSSLPGQLPLESDLDWVLRSRFSYISGRVLRASKTFQPDQFPPEVLEKEPHGPLSNRPGAGPDSVPLERHPPEI